MRSAVNTASTRKLLLELFVEHMLSEATYVLTSLC